MGIFEYFRKRRRIKEAQMRTQVYNSKKESLSNICQFRGCKIKISGVDRFNCTYCGKSFCPKHRVAEEHNCEARPTTRPKGRY
ncbi:MAG: AN1-type zinc finger protein [archaeon]